MRVREYSEGVQIGPTATAEVLLSKAWQQLTVEFLPAVAGSTLDFQILDEPVAAGESFLVDNVSTVIAPTSDAGDGPLRTPALIPLRPSIRPHPVLGTSTIRFATSRRGRLRLTLLDLAGRHVRTLLDASDAPAGLHHATVSRRGEDGVRLPRGVYFWKIEAGEGTASGRLVVLE